MRERLVDCYSRQTDQRNPPVLPLTIPTRTLRFTGSVSHYRQLDQNSVHLAKPLLV
nr:MAG TPA: hypothetical protein [Caudoviricetes sp.]